VPLIVTRFAGDDGPGRRGGELTTLVGSGRDTRLMTIYSYTRLIVYDELLQLQPDLLDGYDVKEARERWRKFLTATHHDPDSKREASPTTM
jgi:peptide/nickel transport system substrate-binding protein